ncbi:MAG: permease [Bacteroidales bacterium]|nr:permease [Bacteroidales bacterium]
MNELLNHFSFSHTRKILIEALVLLNDLWPYLVSGIILTSLVKLLLSRNQVAGFFQNLKNSSIFIAAFLGVISPLGSYIVIPMSAALFLLGTPLPVLMAFLVSSPLIDPNLFLLTAGAFGYELAVARTISAYILGILAGYSTLWLININVIHPDNVIRSGTNGSGILAPNDSASGRSLKAFGIELLKMTRYISKYFFLAILLAAAIKILTPPDLMAGLFRGNDFISVLFLTGAGIPFYVCGGAAIPVVQALKDFGLSNGAILAFFISGPVTKISNLILMGSAFSLRIFIVYISTGIIGAFLLGIIYNFC